VGLTSECVAIDDDLREHYKKKLIILNWNPTIWL
jgi:hypothetical protein